MHGSPETRPSMPCDLLKGPLRSAQIADQTWEPRMQKNTRAPLKTGVAQCGTLQCLYMIYYTAVHSEIKTDRIAYTKTHRSICLCIDYVSSSKASIQKTHTVDLYRKRTECINATANRQPRSAKPERRKPYLFAGGRKGRMRPFGK